MKEVNSRIIALLFLGMLSGLALALFSLLDTGMSSSLPSGAVARVNDRFIGREDYARAVAAVVADSGQALNASQRRRVLDRLIDEELLLQYGQDQGLVHSDRRVRATLVSAVLEAKSVAAETQAIDDKEARDFYQANQAYFSHPQQLRLTVLQFENSEHAGRARQLWLANKPVDIDHERLQHVPDALLPVGKLRQLIGASLTDAAIRLGESEISEVIMLNARPHLIRVGQRLDVSPDFDRIIEQVKAEMRRRSAEEAVREALVQLRDEHDVIIAEDRL